VCGIDGVGGCIYVYIYIYVCGVCVWILCMYECMCVGKMEWVGVYMYIYIYVCGVCV